MKKTILSIFVGGFILCLLSSCESESITPAKPKNTAIKSGSTPIGGGPEGTKVITQ